MFSNAFLILVKKWCSKSKLVLILHIFGDIQWWEEHNLILLETQYGVSEPPLTFWFTLFTVPLTVTHTTAYDTVLNGYKIPKDTWVFAMLFAVNEDGKEWQNPDVFMPERFLDEYGTCKRPQNLVPFGIGKELNISQKHIYLSSCKLHTGWIQLHFTISILILHSYQSWNNSWSPSEYVSWLQQWYNSLKLKKKWCTLILQVGWAFLQA